MVNHVQHTAQAKELAEAQAQLKALVMSRIAILAFIAAFFYMEFASGMPSPVVDGVLFFLCGAVVVSMLVAPLFMSLRLRYPQRAVLWSVVDITFTALATVATYYLLFGDETVPV